MFCFEVTVALTLPITLDAFRFTSSPFLASSSTHASRLIIVGSLAMTGLLTCTDLTLSC